MTATPNDKSLGLTRCTRGVTDTSRLLRHRKNLVCQPGDGRRRQEARHLAAGDFHLCGDRGLVPAVNLRQAATDQLRRAKRGQHHEFKSAHAMWSLDHERTLGWKIEINMKPLTAGFGEGSGGRA